MTVTDNTPAITIKLWDDDADCECAVNKRMLEVRKRQNGQRQKMENDTALKRRYQGTVNLPVLYQINSSLSSTTTTIRETFSVSMLQLIKLHVQNALRQTNIISQNDSGMQILFSEMD